MRRLILACLWLALLPCDAGLAAEVQGLYRIETAVRGRDESARAEDLRAALGRILKRLVLPNALNSATVRGILAKPQNYLLQFDYDIQGEGEHAVPILRVDFDPARLNGELRKHGIAVWGAERPELLIWLAIRDKQGQWSVAAEQAPQVDAILGQLSAETGLPIALPLWDLPDQQALTWADIDTGNSERIRIASLRYETDTILTGRLSPAAGNAWEAEWRLYEGKAEERWQSKAAELRETLNSGMGGAYARLAAHGIPRDVSIASVALTITGIESLEDANRIAAYLEKLSPVAKLEWDSVGTGEAAFKLKVRGGREALRHTLNLSNRLKPLEGEPGGGSGPLIYRIAR